MDGIKMYVKAFYSNSRDASLISWQNGFMHQFVVEIENSADCDYYSAHDSAHQVVIAALTPLINKVHIVDVTNGEF